MVVGICVGGSAVVTESSMFVSSVLSISIPGGCNSLGLVDVFDVIIVVDVVDCLDVVDAVVVIVSASVANCVVVTSMVISVEVVVSVVVVCTVVKAVVVVVGFAAGTVVGLATFSVDVTMTDCVEVASRSFFSINSASISKYVSGLNSSPNISIRSSN